MVGGGHLEVVGGWLCVMRHLQLHKSSFDQRSSRLWFLYILVLVSGFPFTFFNDFFNNDYL